MTWRRLAVGLLAAFLAAPAEAQSDAEARWAGDWVGAYDCAQGDTGLTLRLRPRGDGTLDGLFHFWPRARNPDAAEGCFALRATPAEGPAGGIDLVAGRWLLRPDSYVTVGLQGRLDKDGLFHGGVRGPGCTGFALRRATPPRPQPAACAGPVALR